MYYENIFAFILKNEKKTGCKIIQREHNHKYAIQRKSYTEEKGLETKPSKDQQCLDR